MNKTVIILLLILMAVIGGAGYGYAQLSQAISTAEAIAQQEIEKRKINVKNSTLSKETEFIFTKITNQYTYYYNKKFVTLFSGDRVQIIYQWPYTFSFGIKIPDQWDWCIKPVANEPGYVQVNSPLPSFLSSNPPHPVASDIINAPYFAVNDQTVIDEMTQLATARVNDDAAEYLKGSEVKKNITLAFAKHLQDVMNGSHKDANPVAGVKIHYTDKNVCP